MLDGTNYQQWSSSMQSYLMSQGQWKCAKESAAPPTPVLKTEGSGGDATEFVNNQDDIDAWMDDAEKALGNIRLRLHHTISYQYNNIDSPSTLWETLKAKYGSPGLSTAFVEFKGAMDTVIPNGSDPSPALDKIMSHFVRLKEMKWDIPEKVQAMMILSKAPSSMESLVQLTSYVAKDDDAELKTDKIVRSMLLSWETHGRQGANRNNQQRANKLSAVKPAGQPPQFQQQQEQQRGDGNFRGRGRRGKRGGKKNAQQQLQQAPVQEQPSQGQPPKTSILSGSQQWVPAFTPQFAAGPSNMGYIASTADEVPPPPTTPYAPFNRALSLAHRLGVRSSTETLKTLEIAEIEKAEDPRPKKRARSSKLPRGRAQGQEGTAKGQEKAKDDDEVSLGYTDEDMPDVGFEYDVDDPNESQDYNVDGELADLAGLYNSYWQVQSLSWRSSLPRRYA